MWVCVLVCMCGVCVCTRRLQGACGGGCGVCVCACVGVCTRRLQGACGWPLEDQQGGLRPLLAGREAAPSRPPPVPGGAGCPLWAPACPRWCGLPWALGTRGAVWSVGHPASAHWMPAPLPQA